MGLTQLFKNFFGMIALDEKAYTRATKTTFASACLVFLLVSIASAIGTLFIRSPWTFGGSIGGTLLTAFITTFLTILIGWFFVTAIFWGLARLFGGKGRFLAQYGGMSLILLWFLLNAIPFVGFILAGAGFLWSIIMNIYFIRELHKLPTGKAVLTVVISHGILILLILLLFTGVLLLNMMIQAAPNI